MANKPNNSKTNVNPSAALTMSYFNLDAEQSLLACALLDDNVANDIVLDLAEDDFYSPAHKTVFRAMQSVSRQNKRLDFVVLTDELERNAEIESVGGMDYLATLATSVPTAANFASYLDIVTRESAKRRIARACTGILGGLKQADDRVKMISAAEKAIFDVGQNNKGGDLAHISDTIREFIERCDMLYKDPNSFSGIKTGFKRFDKITNGLHPGDLLILAARPGCGKSSFALNIVEYAAQRGHTCAIFSLEMPRIQIIQRLMCGIANVSMGKVTGSERLVADDLKKLIDASDAVSGLNIFIDDSSLNTPAKIMSKCRNLKARQGLDLVVVDYLQLMQGDEKSENRQQDVSNITRNLKIMAKELGVPVIALSQMNRLFERDKDRKPMLSDLRESGAIEQDADMVLFINKSADAEDQDAMPLELIVAKNRNGETADIPLLWVGRLVHFFDAKTPVPESDSSERAPKDPTADAQAAVQEMADDAPLPTAPPTDSENDFNTEEGIDA